MSKTRYIIKATYFPRVVGAFFFTCIQFIFGLKMGFNIELIVSMGFTLIYPHLLFVLFRTYHNEDIAGRYGIYVDAFVAGLVLTGIGLPTLPTFAFASILMFNITAGSTLRHILFGILFILLGSLLSFLFIGFTYIPEGGLAMSILAGSALIFHMVLAANVVTRSWEKLGHERKLVKLSNIQLADALTQIKSTQSQLIHAEKMASLGELTAGIAHEIKNSLNFVNNFSELNKEMLEELREEAEKGNLEEVQALANDVIANEEKINHHGKRADAIVKGMLAHSRSGKGEKEPTDLNKLADEYLRLSYHGLRAKDKHFNAEFKTHFDLNLPKVSVVPQDIGRVLLNLINNAFQASSVVEQPFVQVGTKKTENGIEISVWDNGPGIPDDIKDKVFQPFFTTKKVSEGTGLGLSLSYDIVKAHGGEIDVSSMVNQGATFTLTFPIKH